MDYANWVQRAIDFTEKLRGLPRSPKRKRPPKPQFSKEEYSDLFKLFTPDHEAAANGLWEQLAREKESPEPENPRIEIRVAPPLTRKECNRLADSCRLPIPTPLLRFWQQASGHCRCTYWWDTPEPFGKQLSVAFPHWSASQICGGADFFSAHEIVHELVPYTTEDCAESFQERGLVRDWRIFTNSLPLMAVGDGSYVGLYVRDSVRNPPVVYMSHEGCGASNILADSWDEFLESWEQLGYIGIDFLSAFRDPRTGLLKPERFPVRLEAVKALLSGTVRSDLEEMESAPTEHDWLSETNAELLLRLLEKRGIQDQRKQRLMACAIARRRWQAMDSPARWGVETAERFADGLASEKELRQAYDKAEDGTWDSRPGSVGPEDTSSGDKHHEPPKELSASARTLAKITARNATANNTICLFMDIQARLDGVELTEEMQAQAEIVRHIYANPFRKFERPDLRGTPIPELARRAYDQGSAIPELRDALLAAGLAELAEHFARPDHPKGCWALDLLLGKEQSEGQAQ